MRGWSGRSVSPGPRLRAEGQGWARRIHAADLSAYAIRTGTDPRAVFQRLQKEREVSLGDVLIWVFVGLGLAWLLNELAKRPSRT